MLNHRRRHLLQHSIRQTLISRRSKVHAIKRSPIHARDPSLTQFNQSHTWVLLLLLLLLLLGLCCSGSSSSRREGGREGADHADDLSVDAFNGTGADGRGGPDGGEGAEADVGGVGEGEEVEDDGTEVLDCLTEGLWCCCLWSGITVAGAGGCGVAAATGGEGLHAFVVVLFPVGFFFVGGGCEGEEGVGVLDLENILQPHHDDEQTYIPATATRQHRLQQRR